MQFFNDILYIFYPNICLSCETVLTKNEKVLCSKCLFDLPLTNFLTRNASDVKEVFYGRIPVQEATALLYYFKKGITQELIHKLKYKNHQEIGTYFGNWQGFEMKKSGLFKNIDYIIPVPLHKKRLKKRGYNQVTEYGKQLAFHLNKPFLENVLVRKSFNKTQTKKSRFERMKNVQELFFLTDITIFENKHILLIDDIITTGATIESCANELLKTKNIQLSIAVIAITE